MLELLPTTFELPLASFLTCLLIREIMILCLPDDVAGPGGSFIDTGAE